MPADGDPPHAGADALLEEVGWGAFLPAHTEAGEVAVADHFASQQRSTACLVMRV